MKLRSQRGDKAIEENLSLEIGQRMTHKAVIAKNEGKIARAFRSLSSGSITKIVRLMDVSNVLLPLISSCFSHRSLRRNAFAHGIALLGRELNTFWNWN